jgi:transglutaminase-like putative cysteine protease
MPLQISTRLELAFGEETDLLLQIEAAPIPEQVVAGAVLDLPPVHHMARVPGHNAIGERVWLRHQGALSVQYRATVTPQRIIADIAALPALPPHQLPGETVEYLMDSAYCPAGRFQPFADEEFAAVEGGARIAAIRDWIAGHLRYEFGISGTHTTALDTFVERRGVCRDYAHLLVTLARASAIPARFASVYAPGVSPQDFHAVAEVFLGNLDGTPGGTWHLVDATGMATAAEIAKIGVGRDAADVSFITSYGDVRLLTQEVLVTTT